MDATSDVWKVVDDCRIAVEGAWSEPWRGFWLWAVGSFRTFGLGKLRVCHGK